MNRRLSPEQFALGVLARCLLLCAIIVLFDPDVLRNPIRAGVVVFVIVVVPGGNYFLARRRASNA